MLPFAVASAANAQEPANDFAAMFQWKAATIQFKKAGELMGERRIAEARSVLERAMQQLAPPYDRMAENHLQSLENAKRQNREILNGYYVYGQIGKLCFELGAYDSAVNWMQLAINAHSEDHHGYARPMAWCLGELRRTTECLAAYNAKIDNLKKESVFSHFVDECQRQKAIVEQREARRHDLEFMLEMVRQRYLEGHDVANKYLAALEVLQECLATAHEKKDVQRIYAMGLKCLDRLHDERGRIAWENHWILQNKGDAAITASVTIDRAKRAYDRRNLDEALRLYRLVCQQDPTSPRGEFTRFMIACVLKEQMQYDEAIAEFGILIDIRSNEKNANRKYAYPNDPHSIVLNIADCYRSRGKFDKELEYLLLARDKFKYQSWCGTCREGAHSNLQGKLEACLAKLGRPAEDAK